MPCINTHRPCRIQESTGASSDFILIQRYDDNIRQWPYAHGRGQGGEWFLSQHMKRSQTWEKTTDIWMTLRRSSLREAFCFATMSNEYFEYFRLRSLKALFCLILQRSTWLLCFKRSKVRAFDVVCISARSLLVLIIVELIHSLFLAQVLHCHVYFGNVSEVSEFAMSCLDYMVSCSRGLDFLMI